MTCRHSRTLLEDFVDSEVDLATAEALKAHVLECAECREEVESSAILKSIIKGLSRPDPGEEYWNEVSALILARTVEAEPAPSPAVMPRPEPVRQMWKRSPAPAAREARSTLYRSVASVAFSLAVLLGAIWLGSQRQNGSFVVETPSQKFLVSASLNSLVNQSGHVYTLADRTRLTGACVLLGPPVHGRLAEFASLMLIE